MRKQCIPGLPPANEGLGTRLPLHTLTHTLSSLPSPTNPLPSLLPPTHTFLSLPFTLSHSTLSPPSPTHPIPSLLPLPHTLSSSSVPTYTRGLCDNVLGGLPDQPTVLPPVCWLLGRRSRENLHPLLRGKVGTTFFSRG